MTPLLVLVGGRAGDLCTLKYAFVTIAAGELELMTRNSVFLAPWERALALAVQIPDNALCRGDSDEFYVHTNSEFVRVANQTVIKDHFRKLVLKECVLVSV